MLRRGARPAWLLALALLLALLLPLPVQAATVRVCLQSGVSTSQFAVAAGSYQIKGGTLTASLLAEAEEGDIIRTVRSGSTITIYINSQKIATSNVDVAILASGDGPNIMNFGNQQYRGSFSVLTNGYVLNVLDMEQYLYGVVGKELSYTYPTEALKAQAIVARSYAYFNRGGTYYDVSVSTASQTYGGYTAEKAAGGEVIVAAVDATAHQVLYYNGEVVEAVYCSSAGGYTENNENVWGGQAMPYLRGVASPYDANYSYMNWEISYTAAELTQLAKAYMKRIGQDESFGNFARLELSYAAAGGGNTVSGRVTKATLVGSGCTVTAQNDAVRNLLGLRSNLFRVKDSVVAPPGGNPTEQNSTATDKVYVLNASGNLQQRNWQDVIAVDGQGNTQRLGELPALYLHSAAGVSRLTPKTSSGSNSNGSSQPSTSVTVTGGVTFVGSGYGHGVGLSQYGAVGMAEQGASAWEILQHYYGGTDSSLLELRTIQ